MENNRIQEYTQLLLEKAVSGRNDHQLNVQTDHAILVLLISPNESSECEVFKSVAESFYKHEDNTILCLTNTNSPFDSEQILNDLFKKANKVKLEIVPVFYCPSDATDEFMSLVDYSKDTIMSLLQYYSKVRGKAGDALLAPIIIQQYTNSKDQSIIYIRNCMKQCKQIDYVTVQMVAPCILSHWSTGHISDRSIARTCILYASIPLLSHDNTSLFRQNELSYVTARSFHIRYPLRPTILSAAIEILKSIQTPSTMEDVFLRSYSNELQKIAQNTYWGNTWGKLPLNENNDTILLDPLFSFSYTPESDKTEFDHVIYEFVRKYYLDYLPLSNDTRASEMKERLWEAFINSAYSICSIEKVLSNKCASFWADSISELSTALITPTECHELLRTAIDDAIKRIKNRMKELYSVLFADSSDFLEPERSQYYKWGKDFLCQLNEILISIKNSYGMNKICQHSVNMSLKHDDIKLLLRCYIKALHAEQDDSIKLFVNQLLKIAENETNSSFEHFLADLKQMKDNQKELLGESFIEAFPLSNYSEVGNTTKLCYLLRNSELSCVDSLFHNIDTIEVIPVNVPVMTREALALRIEIIPLSN